MKKLYSVIFILLAFILSVGYFNGLYSYNALADTEVTLSVKSKSAYLMDYKTKTVIYEKNELERLPIASMCKVMTLLLCFDEIEKGNLSYDEKVVISENSAGMGGSQVFLEKDGEYIVGELIKSIVVASANDACVAMAERIAGSQANFVDKMNEKASELGMTNTVFVNCTGLPQAGQYSCAKDVATMFSKLLDYEDYYKFSKIWTDVVTHPNDRKTEIANTNKLIRFYKGCDSGKTGYTNEAGHCLTASAKRNDMRLVGVVICASNSKERFGDVSSMFNYGFDNFCNKTIIESDKPLDLTVKVQGGKKRTLSVVAESPLYIFCKKNAKKSIEINFEPIKKVCAPVVKGKKVGVLRAFENGIEIGSVNVLANESIMQKTYFDIVKDIVNNWCI
ncbi:MAG: D-alanyl-D-alanine carboxypeptidase [Clostridiales bacterium]|nr:D-alanyl-D-alanine carboxypeptidase [Clostridiales bacterium]